MFGGSKGVGIGIACLLALAGCEQGLETGPNEDKGDIIDQAPGGKTSFGVDLEFINQFGYGLWAQGALNLNYDEDVLGTQLDEDLSFLRDLGLWLDLSGEAKLPPVFDVTDRGVTLAVGELHLDIRGGTDLGQLAVEAVIAVEAEVKMDLSGGILRLQPTLDPEDIHIDLKIQAFAGLKGEAVERMVEGMAPAYVDEFLSRISTLPVPSMDMGPVGIDRVVGLREASLQLSQEGAVLIGQLGDIDPDAVFDTAEFERAPIEESAPALAECLAPDPASPGLEGDCCTSEDGDAGVCTDLDPDGDGLEEAFCPTGATALRSRCPSGAKSIKCCIYPSF